MVRFAARKDARERFQAADFYANVRLDISALTRPYVPIAADGCRRARHVFFGVPEAGERGELRRCAPRAVQGAPVGLCGH